MLLTSKSRNFANYYQKDGLLSDNFVEYILPCKDGTLYFGGIDGMIGLNGVGINHNKKHVQKLFYSSLRSG